MSFRSERSSGIVGEAWQEALQLILPLQAGKACTYVVILVFIKHLLRLSTP